MLANTHNSVRDNDIKKHERYPGGPNALTFAKIFFFFFFFALKALLFLLYFPFHLVV